MPYDDTDVKKMIRYQTERKVGFSRHRQISTEVKELIHGILEAKTERRFSIKDVRECTWMTQPVETTPSTTTAVPTATATAAVTATNIGMRDHDATGDRVADAADRRLLDESDRRATNNNNDRLTTCSIIGLS